MSAIPNQPNVSGQTRDILKSGINLPVVGVVSIAALGIIAGLFLMSRRKKKVELRL